MITDSALFSWNANIVVPAWDEATMASFARARLLRGRLAITNATSPVVAALAGIDSRSAPQRGVTYPPAFNPIDPWMK